MMQPLQVAALAFPVADRIINKLELAQPAEIRDREHALEHALQPRVIALGRQQVHLQKLLIRLLLNLNQIRNRNRGLDLREIHSLAHHNIFGSLHDSISSTQLEKRFNTNSPKV